MTGRTPFFCVALLLSTGGMVASVVVADDFHDTLVVEDTQDPKDVPLEPEEARKRISVPEGFEVTLFAGEPDVRQPIAFALDDRGRLWVAECYSYRQWKPEGHDRILIFEDTQGDGRFDKRKLFWDQGNYLTGLEVGFGGVWVCCAPHLLFIPDRDGDGQPDGEPIVLLDGWSTEGVHNVVNGLTWGPDGWLYGCNGITAPSRVGKPGTPDEERVEINCGIWRYHPTRHEFEVVAHGTTNPWGLDFDEHGQGFFTNCVIGHLWHLIPGARYQRMFGQDSNPHAYGLLEACSDHLHWSGSDWTKSRGGGGDHDALGGGHAHAGAMIYLGDNWPDEYRNSLLTCNIHGNRVNRDLLDRHGSGYVGRHAPDFLQANDPWFRGLELKYGPDGGVYVTDWTDLGECHDADGVHRNSGRIYKISYQPERQSAPADLDLARQTDDELVALQLHKNDWYVRHARRILQERAAANSLSDATPIALRTLFDEHPDVTRKLRALWSLHAVGAADPGFLGEQLQHDNEHVRLWAIRLLGERPEALQDSLAELTARAAEDPSALVRLELACSLQRLPLQHRWTLAERLLQHRQDAEDPNLPLMIWYGIEPAVAADRTRALGLAARCQIPTVRQYIARRVASK